MIRNIIFDIGNVCVTFDPYAYFIEKFKDEEKTLKLCKLMFEHDAWLQYDQGIVYMEDLYEIYHKEFPQYNKEMDWMLAHWMELMKPIPTTFTLMKKLKEAGFHIYLLSNISEDSFVYLKTTQDFFQYVDGMTLSYKEKVIKPDVKIYERLLHTYHLHAEECLFIDDIPDNIDVAKIIGMHGIVYINAEQVEKDVMEQLEEGCTIC